MIQLPWPPTVNHYYSVANSRKILSARGRKYKEDCLWVVAGQKPSKARGSRVSVTIHAHPPDKRKRDLDNLLKPVLDVLTESGVIEDDSQIDELTIIRFPVFKTGKVEIIVGAYEPI